MSNEPEREWGNAPACQRCDRPRVASMSAKCSDMCHVAMRGASLDGGVPSDLGIGTDDDYVTFDWCLDCGQIQGEWPLPQTFLEGATHPEEEA